MHYNLHYEYLYKVLYINALSKWPFSLSYLQY